ncbi:MAG TPA: FtsQ-type POTRA domain-containing protein [Candidatus Bathyarchaeia archaeon]|nr:FtsQ-type POTRA domain-containing protein [Candidatus Bathyarchaeia archaeon]
MKFFKKRRRLIIFTFKAIVSFVVFLGMVVLVVYFFTGDYFKISQIDCEKEKSSCSDKEKTFLVDFLGENIFLFDTKRKIDEIKVKLPYVKTVDIQKHLPHKISIRLVFRQESALLGLNETKWYLIDEESFVLAEVEKKGESLPEIIFMNSNLEPQVGRKLSNPEVSACLLVIKLCQDNFILVKKLTYLPEMSITLDLADDIYATLSAKKEITSQVDSLQFVLRQSKIEGKLPKKIDLRFSKPVAIY